MLVDSQNPHPLLGQMALGVIAGLGRRGIGVPAQVSVIGGDDVPMASVVTPSLTAISLPTEAAGAEAVRLLCEGGAHVDLQSDLVVRASTGPVAR